MNEARFIKTQLADASAAFERLSVLKKALKEIEFAVNKTNTVDIAGERLSLYNQLETTVKLICLQEEMLIHQGE